MTAASSPTRIEREPRVAHASVAAPNAHWSTPGPLRAESCAATVKSDSGNGEPPARSMFAAKPYA